MWNFRSIAKRPCDRWESQTQRKLPLGSTWTCIPRRAEGNGSLVVMQTAEMRSRGRAQDVPARHARQRSYELVLVRLQSNRTLISVTDITRLVTSVHSAKGQPAAQSSRHSLVLLMATDAEHLRLASALL